MPVFHGIDSNITLAVHISGVAARVFDVNRLLRVVQYDFYSTTGLNGLNGIICRRAARIVTMIQT